MVQPLQCSVFFLCGKAKLLAGSTTKGVAVHWASQFKLHKQPGQQYPLMLSDFSVCCVPDVAIQAATIHSTDQIEEEPDQQITYPTCTDGVMLKDVFCNWCSQICYTQWILGWQPSEHLPENQQAVPPVVPDDCSLAAPVAPRGSLPTSRVLAGLARGSQQWLPSLVGCVAMTWRQLEKKRLSKKIKKTAECG